MVAGGFADGNAQDAFCGTTACTISKLYDQSGQGNNLTEAPAGCYIPHPDNESNAIGRPLTVSGHHVYALYMIPKDGYRNDQAVGLPTGTAAQGIYEIADGKRITNPGCCWDFGNARRDNCYTGGTGTMNTIYFGPGFVWGKGAGSGPWFMGDFEGGVWSIGIDKHATNNNLPSSNVDYALGIVKTSTTGGTPQYAIRVGNAQTGGLTTAYDGQAPAAWQGQGAVLLGIGGDNSNGSAGTFFEGAVTAGRPLDATDLAVLQNAQAAGYGR
jgi:hypothetical protein